MKIDILLPQDKSRFHKPSIYRRFIYLLNHVNISGLIADASLSSMTDARNLAPCGK